MPPRTAPTGAPLHTAHVSTRAAIEQIRAAKERGLPITAEVTPHHLTLTHDVVAFSTNGSGLRQAQPDELIYDTNAKVNPPLRSQDDVDACVEALRDGVIDAIATDHAPHADYEKACGFDEAAFGTSGPGTASSPGTTQFSARAMMRGVVVLPTPRTPVRVKAWASLPEPMALVSVRTMASWPIRPEKSAGRYLRARTR